MWGVLFCFNVYYLGDYGRKKLTTSKGLSPSSSEEEYAEMSVSMWKFKRDTFELNLLIS